MKQSLYWIGIRESELQDVHGLFSGSITMFGPGSGTGRSFERERKIRHDYNQDSAEWTEFVSRQAREIIRRDPDSRFMLYAPEEAVYYGPEVSARSVCQNPQSLLELLDDKFRARQWLSEHVPILPYKMQHGEFLSYDSMTYDFPGAGRFVVQSSFSCGGSGTWLVSKENHKRVLARLDQEGLYAVSPYQEKSISPNIHLVIYPEEILLLPPSVQLVKAGPDGFSYQGADFPLYRCLPANLDRQLKTQARDIGDILRKAGYRGVCGIDFLISGNTIYLMEINPRFQSSTFLLNRAIHEAGYQESVQSMHLSAFQEPRPAECIRGLSELSVSDSCFHYEYQPGRRAELHAVWELLQRGTEAQCMDDGLDWSMFLEPHTYLYKAVFHGSIAALSPSFQCRLHVNVGLLPAPITPEELRQNPERLKCMLLAHGVRLSPAASARLEAAGGFNYEEFSALDLTLPDCIYICAPYNTNRSELSPFCVESDPDAGYFLSYYAARVSDVQVRLKDAIGEKQTKHGILYHDISYLGQDRLRVYHRAGCYFKGRGIGCRFCDIPPDSRTFPLEDIFEVTDSYRDHPRIRHYLIGGGSAAPNDDFEQILAIAEHIRSTTGKPIYLMSLPPKDVQILARLKQAGITEVAFNLECFDRRLARSYMPGKGAIPLAAYEKAFRAAVELWGRRGKVRTIFIVGLEPPESLLHGISYVTELGVSPILSLFRPIEDTPLQDLLAPSDEEIWEVYQRAKEICSRRGLALGPACPYCQDNTLTITLPCEREMP